MSMHGLGLHYLILFSPFSRLCKSIRHWGNCLLLKTNKLKTNNSNNKQTNMFHIAMHHISTNIYRAYIYIFFFGIAKAQARPILDRQTMNNSIPSLFCFCLCVSRFNIFRIEILEVVFSLPLSHTHSMSQLAELQNTLCYVTYLRGYCTPNHLCDCFWHFSQKLQHIGGK